MLSKSCLYIAKKFASRGSTVNTVAPGAIETDFLGGAVRDMPDLNKVFAGMTALGRVGVPDDIGPMIANLQSDNNRAGSQASASKCQAAGQSDLCGQGVSLQG